MDLLNLSGLTIDQYLKNEAEYLKLLQDNPKAVQTQVPLLNYGKLHDFADNTLVRFRGMIQDMNDAEIYLERYEISSTTNGVRVQDGRYRDVIVLKPDEAINHDAKANAQGERRSLFLVTVPGLNEWAEAVETRAKPDAEQSMKRPVVAADAMDITDPIEPDRKRIVTADGGAAAAVAAKDSAILSAEYLLNSPLPDRPSKACICKIYHDFESFKLNSVVEMIGFLSVDPSLDGSRHACSEFEDLSEIQAANPPPHLIPRLHCVSSRLLTHYNPLLWVDDEPSAEQDNIEIIKDLRMALSQCLFGDVVASEYLLCHLISTVYVQNEMQTLGQFSLNLSNFPATCLPNYIEEFYELLASMLPASYLMPLTLESLNTDQFTPK